MEDMSRVDLRVYDFNNVVGNTSTTGLMKRSLVRKKFPKVAIMGGQAGTGKSTCADIAGMVLTCVEPIDGNPCLKCRNCLDNLQALKTTGRSRNVIKLNLGKLNTKKDIQDMIKEIFVLEAPIGNNVYQLGEMHCVSAADQASLLEEIDKLDDNTYIIITTTKTTSIIPELRSRSISFNFSRLNKTECKLLFDRTCKKLGISKVPQQLENIIINYSRGIPRDMVNIIDFVNNTSPTIEEIKAFLNVIDSSLFTDLVSAMHNSLKETVMLMDYMFNTYSYDVVLEQFKKYFVDAMFFITAGIEGELTKEDCKTLGEILNSDSVYKVSKLLQDVNPHKYDEADVKMQFIKIRQALAKKKVGDIITENTKNASSQHVHASRLYNERKDMKEESKKVASAKLTTDSLKNLLTGAQTDGKPSNNDVTTHSAKETTVNSNSNNTEVTKKTDSTNKMNIFGGE